jgi:hypothetical protein
MGYSVLLCPSVTGTVLLSKCHQHCSPVQVSPALFSCVQVSPALFSCPSGTSTVLLCPSVTSTVLLRLAWCSRLTFVSLWAELMLRGCAMAQAVGPRPVTTEACVRSQACLCGICGRYSGTVKCSLLQFSPVRVIPAMFHTHSFTTDAM